MSASKTVRETAVQRAAVREAGFKTVLVATDFSPGGSRAVLRAARLPLAPGSRLILLHVLPEGLPDAILVGAQAEADASAERAVRDATKAARAEGSRDVKVLPLVASGEAALEIVRCARAESADLVVLGRHGRRPVRDLFLGSTAHRVVRQADLPVLVVSGSPAQRYARPLVALDLQDTARQTLDLLVSVLGSRVRSADVVHAFEVPFEALAFPGFDTSKLTRWGRKFEVEAQQRLKAFLAGLPDLGVRWVPAVRGGSAATQVLTQARDRDADLLAIGTHGRSGLARLLLGSVAEQVLAGARCDVLIARPARHSFEMPSKARRRAVGGRSAP